MINHDEYIKRYVTKAGLLRNKKDESSTADLKNINVFVIFGELPETVMFGLCLYKSLCCANNTYNIVISWPGLACFFPDANEFWSPSPNSLPVDIYEKAYGSNNNSKYVNVLLRSINEHFVNVRTAHEYSKFFDYFIKDEFFKHHKEIDFLYPPLLPANILSRHFVENVDRIDKKRIMLMPFKKSRMFQDGKSVVTSHYDVLYEYLINALLQNNYTVFCVQNEFTFDLSKNLANDSLFYIKEYDFNKIITISNSVGCFLDFFGNSSFVGLLSQSRTFNIAERQLWFGLKKEQEYQIYKSHAPYKNFFSFLKFNDPYDKDLNISYFKNIINSLNYFCNESNLVDRKGFQKHKTVSVNDISKAVSNTLVGKPINLKG